jgi:hypothetical protein
MSYPQTSVHPLEREGTAQRERLLKAILPENLLLDNRNIADLLAFAGEYAGQIRYWNQDNAPDGDWTAFWEQDVTALLAIVAATDLDQLQVRFRSAELDFVRSCKKEKKKEGIPYCEKALVKLHLLVVQIFEVAALTEQIYAKLPQNHPIREEAGALIRGKLGVGDQEGNKNFDSPLAELISYHKGIGDGNELVEQYQPLIGDQGAWGLTVHDFLNCIDYRQITHKDQEELWRLFLEFFKVLTLIVSRAMKAFQLSLNGRDDHPPHIALFLSFCLLFRRYHQTELNGMVGKHLDYYYRDILRLQERREIPDQVHLVFEIARDLESFRLPEGTLVLGGKDKNGDDLLYGLASELILNKALLVEKQNLYFYQDETTKLIPVALPFADRKDGFKIPYPKGQKLWYSLWAAGLYKKLAAKFSLFNNVVQKNVLRSADGQKLVEQRNRVIGRPGFLISSPELFLAKGGVRQITVTGLDPKIIQHFDATVSTKKQAEPVASDQVELKFTINTTSPVPDSDITVSHMLTGTAWVSSNGTLTGTVRIQGKGDHIHRFFGLALGIGPTPGVLDETMPFSGSAHVNDDLITINSFGSSGKSALLPVILKTKRNNTKIEKVTIGGVTAELDEIGAWKADVDGHNIQVAIDKVVLGKIVQFTLPEAFPDVAPLINDPWLPGDQPFLRFTLKPGKDLNEVLPEGFRQIGIQTSNSNLRNVSVQVGDTVYAPTSDIPLIGTNTHTSRFSLYVIAPEMSAKNVTNPVLNVPTPDQFDTGVVSEISRVHSGIFHPAKDQGIDLSALDVAAPVHYTTTTPYAYFRKDIVIPDNGSDKPLNMFRIPGESISVSYTSDPVTIGLAEDRSVHKLYHIDYLGGYAEAKQKTLVPGRTLPAYDAPIGSPQAPGIQTADGTLRLGIQGLLPEQTLSMLFYFAEGTGNPDRIAPDEIVWSYLRDNDWVRIPPQYVLSDETLGLRKTGIIRFQVPGDIHNGNTLALGENGRKDLYWLQASAAENPALNIGLDALPQLKDIFAQACTAVFENNNNDLAHIDNGLPAASISQLRFRDAGISRVEQPFISFGGRRAESGDPAAYYRRVHERLRHKNRAITVWDYERLVLENFPKVSLVKCLQHTRDTDVRRPGYVSLAAVPYPADMTGDTRFYPIFNAGDLEEIERFLNKRNTYFVGRLGGGVVCCCNSGCGSGCKCGDDGRLLVRNAIFEPVRLQVCVKFRPGREELFYKKELNDDLKKFLAPWATDDQAPLVFGTRIHTVELLRFLEDLDYVDVVLGIKVKHFPSREAAGNNEALIDFEEVEIIEAFTSRSLLTTYLDILNEDNPNVLDHQILIAGQPGCEDCGC